MSTQPRVSIGLPVYNGERYLRTAIDSLLAQTFTDFELIISDNGSTDDTPAIGGEAAARDERVRFHREGTNRGAAWNFNRTVELARGRYFRWAAADDVSLPTLLERTVEVLDRDPGVVWCHSRTQLVNADGVALPHRAPLSYREREAAEAHHRFASVLLGAGGNRDVYGLMRIDVLRRTSKQLPHYGADKVLMGELALLGRYHEVPDVLFHGRVHEGGSGALGTARAQREFIAGVASPRRAFTRWELLRAHHRAIGRSGLSAAERARCRLILLRYLLQVRKWPAVMTKSVKGAGTGGGYVNELDSGKRSQPGKEPA